MRLVFRALFNLLAVLGWPLRALVRGLFGHRAPAWVELTLKGELNDYGQKPSWLGRRLGQRPLALGDLRRIFERAATETRCRGVVLKITSLHGSAAQLGELARLIAELRQVEAAAGSAPPARPGKAREPKAVVVWAEALDGRSYAALCGATRLHLPPGGSLNLSGVAVELTSAGAALSGLGVRPEFFRREEHKTAPELFTRTEASPAQRETANAMLDAAYDALVSNLGRRGLPPELARELIDGGPYLGQSAAACGLLDKPLFWDELVDELEGEGKGAGLASPKRLRTSGRVAKLSWRPLRPEAAVALVPLRGLIRGGRNGQFPGGSRFCGSDSLGAALERARDDRRIQSVLLYIDSRGGSAPASELMWREVQRTAKKKPVIAYVDAVAASGGYYAACGATRILAAPLSIVGSIGVFYGRFELSEGLARLGVHRELLVRGAHAGLVWPTRPLTPAERDAADGLVEAIYQDFLKVVAQARHRTPEEIRPLAGGRVYTGAAAAKVGLVDATSSFREALQEAATAGGLRPSAYPPVRLIEERRSGLRAMTELGSSLEALTHPNAFALHLGPGWPA